jgi:hypothetical protein
MKSSAQSECLAKNVVNGWSQVLNRNIELACIFVFLK